MGNLINRLDTLYREHLKDILPLDELRLDTLEYDYNGGAKSILFRDYRFLAVCEYNLQRNKKKFYELMNKSAFLVLRIFEEFNSGKPIAISYLNLGRYKNVLDASASGDLGLTRNLAKLIGERPEDKKEKGFFPALSYCIKYLTLKDEKNLEIYVEKCNQDKEHKKAKNHLGYLKIADAVLRKNEKQLNDGFLELIEGHKRLCKGAGEFSDSEDEIIFLHGLGLANICLDQGFSLKFEDPLIPKDLLIK